jgi:hypothetical protein
MENKKVHALINSVIMVSNKFIYKVQTGRARSRETLSDLQKLKAEAELLRQQLIDEEKETNAD